jgi:hypothetical protein
VRIGIVIGSDTQSGGGFQHEIAIIENLKEHASNCGHKFYIFSHNFLFDEKELKCDYLKFIKVIKVKKPFILQVINYISLEIMNNIRSQHYQSIKTPMHKAIAENKIELMYYPGPYGYSLTLDLPYILTVWDLQHRVHPEFPEVGYNGEWKGRENLYQEAIGKAFAIIVDEEAGKEDVIRFYNVRGEKVFVLPFIPPKMNRTGYTNFKSLQDKYKIHSDYIFYPAQFWPHKNHVAILKAVRILKEIGEYILSIDGTYSYKELGNAMKTKEVIAKAKQVEVNQKKDT